MSLKNILVVVRKEPDAKLVLEKAALIASGSGASVHVIRVIYDEAVDARFAGQEDRQKMKTFAMQAEEEYLEQLVDEYRSKFEKLETATVWNRRSYQGVLDVAKDVRADLIIKGAEVKSRVTEVIRTPDDWHLLREAACPVMLVKLAAWTKDRHVVAAVDVLDDDHAALNRRVLSEANAVASGIGAKLHLATTFPSYQPWASEMAVAYDYVKLRRSIEQDIEGRQKKLLSEAKIDARCHSIEGEPAHSVDTLADDLGAEIIVLGTSARRGISAFVFGNTSESLLHLTQRDVLVVRDRQS